MGLEGGKVEGFGALGDIDFPAWGVGASGLGRKGGGGLQQDQLTGRV